MKRVDLKDDELKLLSEHVYGDTNPIKPHEASIISSILGISKGAHHWRFQKQCFCKNCGREISVLDYFLASLKHHSPQFIANEICPDLEESGICDHDADITKVDRAEIVEHASDIDCVNCGTILQRGYPLYMHPGCGGFVIRMSDSYFNETKSLLF